MASTLSTLQEIDNTTIAPATNCDIEDVNRCIHIKDRDLKIVCQNIRSVYANIDNLEISLNILNFMPHVLILTECHINKDKPTSSLYEYTAYKTTNHINKDDGVVAYIKNEIVVTEIKVIKLKHASCIQIDTYGSAILGIYRSLSNPNAETFIKSLNSHLETLKSYKNIIITGDININLIPIQTEPKYVTNNRAKYLNMLSVHGIVTGHDIPTRLNNCLDHFMVKLEKNNLSVNIAVLNTSVTDHCMIFMNMSGNKLKNKSIKIKTVTDFNKALTSLAEKNLLELLQCYDPNAVVEQLVSKITKSLEDVTK